LKPIVLASDHGGYELKEKLKTYLMYKDYRVEDVGTHSADTTDYPIWVKKGVSQVLADNTYGIFVCGAGIGVSIAANRNKGIRAAVVHSEDTARLAREHNNANVLCLGGRFLTESQAEKIVDIFLETKFDQRHVKRVEMLEG